MKREVGPLVVEVLEQAGTRFLEPLPTDVFQVFLHHVGATGSFRKYDGRKVYWQRLQILLDTFFTAVERAEICDELVSRLDLVGRRDAYDFFAEALAERRLRALRRELIDA